jgi:predicted small secreted protein
MKKFSLFMLAGALLATSLTGCNTVKGAGQDVTNAGNGIQHAAS